MALSHHIARSLSLRSLVNLLTLATLFSSPAWSANPTLSDPSLQATTVVSGLTQPIAIAFLGPNDFLVTEKASGQVKRVVNGVVTAVVLDLPVNSNSERGLLGIALHPQFPTNPSVYLYWSESSTGADSTVVTEVGNPASIYPPGTPQPLGNRVDRFTWNPAAQTLTYAQNIIRLHAFQHDNNNPTSTNPLAAYQANHNCGRIAFGPDGKLYVMIGDNGRRGWLQNLTQGAFIPPAADDEFGGPEPDNNHVTGSIFRLNDDGSTPSDNPFFAAGASLGGEVGSNLQKLFSYGHRNGFGLTFDPLSGNLWDSENGDDAFDEINRIVPGGNYGWVQIMGPISRIAEFKLIEMNFFTPPGAVLGAMQQIRYPPTRLAYTPALVQSRLYSLPGSTYVDPEMSWRYSIPPSGLGFVVGDALGAQYNGTLWSGEARPTDIVGGTTGTYAGGALMVFRLTADRAHLDLSADPRLADRVADNGTYPLPVGTPAGAPGYKFDGRESESLLIGQNFGVVTDILTGPDGGLYVVSNTDNIVYRITRVP